MREVKGRVEVFLDGGVRHGTDVLKALALGANAVFIGRPILWGLAVNVSFVNIFSLATVAMFAICREKKVYVKCYV